MRSQRIVKRRYAFTLVELLVVIAIMGTLMATLLPAISGARERARQNTCMNNVRTLAQGTATFVSKFTKQEYPGFRGNQLRNVSDAPWVVTILPHIEDKAEYDKWQAAYDSPSPGQNYIPPYYSAGDARAARYSSVLVCPSDPQEDTENPYLSYVMNCGYADGNTSSPYLARDNRANAVGLDLRPGLVYGVGRPQPMTAALLVDGASRTLIYSENVQARWYGNADTSLTPPSNDLEMYVGFLFNPTSSVSDVERPNGIASGWNSSNLPPVATSNMHARPSSYHPTTFNVAFADVSTKTLSENINYSVYKQLMTPDNRKSILKDLPTPTNPYSDTFSDGDL
jgi:prepilin-type N-terminal cleavage/methylation domain-containing protein